MLSQEYNQLMLKRVEAVEDLKKAREMGDLSENGYYKSAKAKLFAIDRRLRWLSDNLKRALIIEKNNGKCIGIGSTVVVSEGERSREYKIVGDLEANPGEGKLSLMSPLGKAIMNQTEGARVEVKTPKGIVFYTIKSIF